MSWFGSWFGGWFGPWFGDGIAVPPATALPTHVRVVDDRQGVSALSGQTVIVVDNAANLIVEDSDA